MHLLVDGKPIEGVRGAPGIHIFRIPPNTEEVRVVSRAGVPMELGTARDPRSLGVAIRQIRMWRGAELRIVDASDRSLSNGFHLFEEANGWRWTDGDALLPGELFAPDDLACTMEVHVACTTTYPLFADRERAAA